MISRDWLTTGIALVLAPVPPTVWAFYRTRARFEDWYYLALAALADGDVLGEISESAPTSSYFGISFVDRLPVRIRPLVAKDLRQAWRRSRLEHIVLLMGAVAFMPMARRRGADLLEEGWLWPLIWLIVLAASTPAFRMTRAPSDAPWHWLSLPVSLTRQYFARWAAVAFFVLLVAPFLAVGARWSGQGWAISLGGVGLVCVGASWIATNLALFFFGPSRWGVALLAGMTVGALVLGRGDPLEAGGWLFVAATFSAVPLRSLASRMAAAEHRG